MAGRRISAGNIAFNNKYQLALAGVTGHSPMGNAVRVMKVSALPASNIAAPVASASDNFRIESVENSGDDLPTIFAITPQSYRIVRIDWPDGSSASLPNPRAPASKYWQIKAGSIQPNGKILVAASTAVGSPVRKFSFDYEDGVPAAPYQIKAVDDAAKIAVVSGKANESGEVEIVWPNGLGKSRVFPDVDGNWSARAPARMIEGVILARVISLAGKVGIAATVVYPASLIPKEPWDIRIDDSVPRVFSVSGKADAADTIEVVFPDQEVSFRRGIVAPAPGAPIRSWTVPATNANQPSGPCRITAINRAGYRSPTVERQYVDLRKLSAPTFSVPGGGGGVVNISLAAMLGLRPPIQFTVNSIADAMITVVFVGGRVEKKKIAPGVASVTFDLVGDELKRCGRIAAFAEDASGNISDIAELAIDP